MYVGDFVVALWMLRVLTEKVSSIARLLSYHPRSGRYLGFRILAAIKLPQDGRQTMICGLQISGGLWLQRTRKTPLENFP